MTGRVDEAAVDRAIARELETLRLRDWLRSCLAKVHFRNADDAERQARRRLRRNGAKLYPYACRHCGGWHLTRRPQP